MQTVCNDVGTHVNANNDKQQQQQQQRSHQCCHKNRMQLSVSCLSLSRYARIGMLKEQEWS